MSGISLQTLAIVEAWEKVARPVVLKDARTNGRQLPDSWQVAISECRAAAMTAGPSVSGRVRDVPPPVLAPSTQEVGVDQAAARLGVTTRTIRRRCVAGTIQARKLGRQWLVALPKEETTDG